MADQPFEIVFRGDIAPGQNMLEVRRRVQELFKADDQKLARLFSGRPVVIRRDLDRAAAERYRDAILKTGAVVEMRSAGPQPAAAAAAEPAPSPNPFMSPAAAATATVREPDLPIASEPDSEAMQNAPDWGVTPVGGDLLEGAEKTPWQEVEVDTSGMSVAASGADLLGPDERQPFEPRDIDTSALSLDN